MVVIITTGRYQPLKSMNKHTPIAIAVGNSMQMVPVGIKLTVIWIVITNLTPSKSGVGYQLQIENGIGENK